MLTAVLLTAALAPPPQAQSAADGLTGQGSGAVHRMADLVPEDDEGVGGVLESTAVGPPLVTVQPSGPYQFQVVIERTGTGYKEFFQVQMPKVFTTKGSPLLVVFHGYGNTAKSILTNTDFFREAFTRGWFAVAPLGAAKKSYSSLPSQQNTELVLEWMMQAFGLAIDEERIYGVGFSMGGGNALNYAARHLDPSRPMFAALINHTGTVDLKDVYVKEDDGSPCTFPVLPHCVLEFWYGGPPAAFPFQYERSSVIDRHPSLLVVPGTDLARNLTHVPVRNVYATLDPLTYLVTQTKTLHKHLGNLGGTTEEVAVPGSMHTWATLDEEESLDWLQGFRLDLPRAESTLADRDGVWFHFRIAQDASGAFTPFTWEGDPRSNAFRLSATKNLATIQFDPGALDLRSDLPLEVELSTDDGLADEVQLLGYDQAPGRVLRDGAATTAWLWEEGTGRLRLLETDGTVPHVWTVYP